VITEQMADFRYNISQEDAENLVGSLPGQFDIEIEVLLPCGYL
jgi:hypothetical protein